jgi:predicted  nucleic acid-binding Zn-ribbon protein
LYFASSDIFENIRPLVRERENISKDIARLKTEIKANLVQLFPELLKNKTKFDENLALDISK